MTLTRILHCVIINSSPQKSRRKRKKSNLPVKKSNAEISLLFSNSVCVCVCVWGQGLTELKNDFIFSPDASDQGSGSRKSRNSNVDHGRFCNSISPFPNDLALYQTKLSQYLHMYVYDSWVRNVCLINVYHLT